MENKSELIRKLLLQMFPVVEASDITGERVAEYVTGHAYIAQFKVNELVKEIEKIIHD